MGLKHGLRDTGEVQVGVNHAGKEIWERCKLGKSKAWGQRGRRERGTNGVERYRRGAGGRVKHVGKEVQERGSNRGKTWGREVEERCRWA